MGSLFGLEVFFVLGLEAVMKSAASASRWLGNRTAGRDASLELVPLDLVLLEAAIAADLITTCKFLHAPPAANPFLDPAV